MTEDIPRRASKYVRQLLSRGSHIDKDQIVCSYAKVYDNTGKILRCDTICM